MVNNLSLVQQISEDTFNDTFNSNMDFKFKELNKDLKHTWTQQLLKEGLNFI